MQKEVIILSDFPYSFLKLFFFRFWCYSMWTNKGCLRELTTCSLSFFFFYFLTIDYFILPLHSSIERDY